MLNLVMFSHSPYIGGAERMLLNLAILLKRGNDINPIVLIPLAEKGHLHKKLDENGIMWRNIPLPPYSFYLYHPHAIIQNASYIERRVKLFAEYIVGLQADVVLANTLTIVEPLIAAKRTNTPSILWTHGVTDVLFANPYRTIGRFFEDLALRIANKIVFCSHWTAEGHNRKHVGKKGVVIHNWTDWQDTLDGKPARNKAFVMMSSVQEHKGIDVAVQAMAALRDRGTLADLEIYSNGAPWESSIRELIERLDLSRRVQIYRRSNNVNEIYDRSFALVFPSYVEPFGMLSIEAMARGLPVIASRVGGAREIIEENVTGLFFRAGDSLDLADKMQIMLDSPHRAEDIGRAGFMRARPLFDGTLAMEAFTRVIKSADEEFRGYDEDVDVALSLLHSLSA